MQTKNVHEILASDDSSSPIIIAGPCSVESPEQVEETIKNIAKYSPQVNVIRGGIWKPRTRPDSFEGVGEKALPWLKSACENVGLPCAVEVANASHVDHALKSKVDIVWIGARTTVNPFIVQEIADALKGVDIPVLVKNPVNPDLNLWIGGIERLEKAGIASIAAIHRGFSSYEKTKYRNRPRWEIPIELRRQLPDLKIICDPSHIAGDRNLIPQVSQNALDLGMNGLMIETHYDPSIAKSDAAQQVTPEQLQEVLSNLVYRRTSYRGEGDHDNLADLRGKIDRLDNYILELFTERMQIAQEIGQYKNDHNLAVYQPRRWASVLERVLAIANENGLTSEFVLNVFQQIHKESIKRQRKVMNVKKDN